MMAPNLAPHDRSRGYRTRALVAATRKALAAMVSAGFSAAEEGKQALSTTQRLSTSCVRHGRRPAAPIAMDSVLNSTRTRTRM